jgi:hypothetical protein
MGPQIQGPVARSMNNILFDYLDDFCTVYLDDILIYSDDLLSTKHMSN